jgi:putative exosortase-associated protein (TIGR04073 family)
MTRYRDGFIRCMLALVLVTPLAWGEDLPQQTPQAPDRVDEMMGRYNLYPALVKGGRGIANFLGGWLEIPLNVHQHFSTSDTAGSWFTGLGYGIVKAAVRTGVGLYEMVTFPLPYPEDFAPILPTLPYYQKDVKRKALPLE